jgi:NAD(P)-dependent dehydrogenase (short-subunit alcohol dehydrogenase family)
VEGIVLIDLALPTLEQAVSSFTPEARERCELMVADVTSEEATEKYVARALERWGRLDISVQNAGIASDRVSILETEASLWQKTMDVNALGGEASTYVFRKILHNAHLVFLGIKHSGRAMMKNPGGASGSIVVVSSQLGLQGTYVDFKEVIQRLIFAQGLQDYPPIRPLR